MNIPDALDLYLVQIMADGRSKHTRAQYRRHIGLLAQYFPEHHVEELLHVDLARFLSSPVATRRPDGKEKRPSSTNALRSSVRTFFAYLAGARIVPTNTAALVRRARCGPPLPRALSDADRERLVRTLDGATTDAERRDRALFRLLLGAGLRLGSAVALDVGDLNLGAGEVRLRTMKGGREDVAFVPEDVLAILREYLGGRTEGPVFVGEHGARIGPRQVHRRLAKWAKRAGIARGVHPHALRHTFACRVYARTQDILVTARALSHRSVTTTAIYATVDGSVVRGAVASSRGAVIGGGFNH